MLDDIAKLIIRFFEKNADDLVRGTSQLGDNFLARVAAIQFFRFFFDESIAGKPILKDWVIASATGIVIIGIVIIASLCSALIRKRNSIRNSKSVDGD